MSETRERLLVPEMARACLSRNFALTEREIRLCWRLLNARAWSAREREELERLHERVTSRASFP